MIKNSHDVSFNLINILFFNKKFPKDSPSFFLAKNNIFLLFL
jgi:hypothetical protein